MIKKRVIVPLLMLVSILLLVSCAGSSEPAEPPATPAPETPVVETTNPPEPEPVSVEEPSEDRFPFLPFPLVFSATDLYGNEVTETSLGEKRLFFIHYWATWCGPCVQEMPDLARVAADYGDQVGFIALLDDYDSNLSGAKRITESAGVPSSFVMVDAKTPDLRDLLAVVQTGYVPTTVIMIGSGGIFDPPLVGAYGEAYAQILDMLLE